MTRSGITTGYAISPDSGEHWTAEGAWEVAPGVHRIPLPLPTDALKAVNVYVLSVNDGLVLIDGGWAIPQARKVLEQSLRQMGAGFGDVRKFLVTHVHRDHYSMARLLGTELGADVTLGRGEKPALAMLQRRVTGVANPFSDLLIAAGAADLVERWRSEADGPGLEARWWQYPDRWLDGDHQIVVGRHTLDAVQTPGHTPGHYVFADRAEGVLYAGDHVLPTITPSIGFTFPVVPNPLGDFMASLTKVRALPDLRVLPAHGPVAPSTHARVDELLVHHERRLALCLDALARGPRTPADVAADLPWTRHDRAYSGLDVLNKGMAIMETKAHLELLAVRGDASRTVDADGVVTFAIAGAALADIS
jgi:glyoxylase-like metal-dependent hydrolase (beta-lactamase superfamily II)